MQINLEKEITKFRLEMEFFYHWRGCGLELHVWETGMCGFLNRTPRVECLCPLKVPHPYAINISPIKFKNN